MANYFHRYRIWHADALEHEGVWTPDARDPVEAARAVFRDLREKLVEADTERAEFRYRSDAGMAGMLTLCSPRGGRALTECGPERVLIW